MPFRPPPALAFLAALPAAASAATIHVPDDYGTIYEALDDALSGDIVLVGPGTYSETAERQFQFDDPPGNTTLTAVGFLPAGVTLESETGPATTILEIAGGTRTHCLVAAQTSSSDASVIRGFGFRRLGNGPSAINIREMPEGWRLRVEECEFVSLQGSHGEAAGIYRPDRASQHLEVVNCLFDDVDGDYIWGAVFVGQTTSFAPASLTVTGSKFRACDRRAIHSLARDLVVTDCVFEDCRSIEPVNWAWGSAVRTAGSTSTITDCSFTRCSDGPIVNASGTAIHQVQRCTFRDCSGHVAAMSSSASDNSVEDCWFEGCEGTNSVLRFGSSASREAHVRRNVFVDNSVEGFGATIYWPYMYGSITENTFVDCRSGYAGGATTLYLIPTWADTEVARNVFAGSSGAPAVILSTISSHPELLVESCNAYWGNEQDTDNFTMAANSFVADPGFCDPDASNFTLTTNSPCLPGNHPTGADCGLIGARDEGCGPVSVRQESWAKIKARYR